ncbi:glutaredoxin family protein [Clostridium sp.]|jgi:glutaredoxin 3|uniref:glutaredoxin family protein n=1 Tax=Clostridium sp. TaxID=1506 RepID=UPI0039F47988
MIKIYSTPTCPWCKKAKSYLESKNIPFEDINVASDLKGREEMFKLSGQSGVPVLDICGNVVLGFDKNAIDEALTTCKH